MVDISSNISTFQYVSERLRIEKFQEIQQKAVLNLLEGKYVFSSTANGLRKIHP